MHVPRSACLHFTPCFSHTIAAASIDCSPRIWEGRVFVLVLWSRGRATVERVCTLFILPVAAVRPFRTDRQLQRVRRLTCVCRHGTPIAVES